MNYIILMKRTYWLIILLTMLLPIPARYSNSSLSNTSKSLSKEFTFLLYISTKCIKENSKCSMMILMGVSQTAWIFTTFPELIFGNNKASLVNKLVTFCCKLEYSFFKETISLLYLHFPTTAKVLLPKK